MKSYVFLLVCGLLMVGCDDNGGNDCALVDCAFQAFSIEFVDTNGNNLIANGTYQHTEIIVTKDGVQLNSNQSTSDKLFFEIKGDVGENSYEIKLNDVETDILVLGLSGDNVDHGCCGPYFPITQILYNGEEQDDVSEDELYFKEIIIIKRPLQNGF